uniref:COesterase domain-containing protein n=1 Tax=Rhabditophanes sp. KR3021 TaxID=114890 RepID=A0AC35TVD0_9BILA
MASEAFKKEHIVPDVVSVAPENVVKVSFGGGLVASLGNILTPTQVQKQPSIHFDADKKSLYTLIMTDPDAPSRKTHEYREWHHWLVVNIPGEDVSKGDVLSEFISSGPPPGTGLHRYVYLVYKQQGPISDPEHGHLTNRSGDNRGGFRTEDFAKKHNLQSPIAGNFYQAEYDDYVPILYKQLDHLFKGKEVDAYLGIPFATPMTGDLSIGISTHLIGKRVVVVTIEYRLAYLGFLSTYDEICPGNNGLWDMKSVLEWVKDNMEKFGGNSGNVTIFEQSAGKLISFIIFLLIKCSGGYAVE